MSIRARQSLTNKSQAYTDVFVRRHESVASEDAIQEDMPTNLEDVDIGIGEEKEEDDEEAEVKSSGSRRYSGTVF